MAEKKSSVKKRNWAFVVYPTKEQLQAHNCAYNGADGYGTLPNDWQEILQLSGIQAVISPLHDKDLNADGEPKKPHYHVIVIYGAPTTYNNVKSLTDKLNAPVPQALEQVRGYYRYLTHKDNPEKYQYDEKDIKPINGFNIADFIEMTKSEVIQIKFELHSLIEEQGFTEYQAFCDYVKHNLDRNFYDVATSNTIFFNTYLKSYRHNRDRQERADTKRVIVYVDRDTGEIINDSSQI